MIHSNLEPHLSRRGKIVFPQHLSISLVTKKGVRQQKAFNHFPFLYRVFIKYCVFPKNFVIFLNSASSAAALVFYLPGVCTHTDTEGKQRKARVRNIFKSSEKTQYLMNTLYNTYPKCQNILVRTGINRSHRKNGTSSM